MEPPPAPIVDDVDHGQADRPAADAAVGGEAGLAAVDQAMMSAEVPPMSMPMRFGCPALAPT